MLMRAILSGLGLAAAITTAASADDRSVICARGHSQTLRLHGPEYGALRNAAFARAGVSVEQQCSKPIEGAFTFARHFLDDLRPDCYILDHIVPLELCLASDNCNRLDNIQIQTRDDAAAKDRIENQERARYCRGDETRDQAISHFTRGTP